MAIDLRAEYPDQVIHGDAGYPYGMPRNRSVPGDPTGTPWEARLIRDGVGLHQALLVEAEIAPSGEPDQVGASQYLEAIKTVSATAAAPVAAAAAAPALAQLGIVRSFAYVRLAQGTKGDGQAFSLGLVLNGPSGTFSVPIDRVQVASAGTWEIEACVALTCATPNWRARMDLVRESNVVVATIDDGPFDADAVITVRMIAFVQIADPPTQKLLLMSRQNGLTALGSLSPQRSMLKVSRIL